MSRAVRVLELYCGIGGCAAALSGLSSLSDPAGLGASAEVVAAIDIDRRALAVYRRSFAHGDHDPTLARNLEWLTADELAAFGADLWWLSPPCQPFTRRGLRRDDEDPRSRSLLALAERLDELGRAGAGPTHLALENVPGFAGSRTHGRVTEVLARHGWHWVEGTLCPTELGVPNRRRRYYLAASRAEPPEDFRPADPRPWTGTLRDLLGAAVDREPDDSEGGWPPALRVDPALADRYPYALDVIGPDEPGRPTACFTAAYGRSPVRSGSYLALGGEPGLRRFSPREVLTLLGFPDHHTLPDDLPPEKAWPLAGNSLSVPAVRRVLAALPVFAGNIHP